MKSLLALLGRVFLSSIFIASAANKILNWEENLQLLLNGMCHWLSTSTSMPLLQAWLENLLPHTSFLLILATLFEAVGGLLVLFGINMRMGAFLLLLFMVPTTILLHAFWMAPFPDRELQIIMFLKNISIMGGLLLLLAYGGKEGASIPK